MTQLQQMAFDRIATLNKECQKMVSSNKEISVDTLHELSDKLWEQESIIEALWDEERKDGCEETI